MPELLQIAIELSKVFGASLLLLPACLPGILRNRFWGLRHIGLLNDFFIVGIRLRRTRRGARRRMRRGRWRGPSASVPPISRELLDDLFELGSQVRYLVAEVFA